MDYELLIKLWVVVGLIVVLLGLVRREDARDPDDRIVGFRPWELVSAFVLSPILWPVLAYNVVSHAFLNRGKE